MGLRHHFDNGKTDGGDTTIVRPSDWNAELEVAPKFGGPGREIIAGDFVLSGWGSAAAVSSPVGYDDAHEYILTAGSTGMVFRPTIVFTNVDGTKPRAPVTFAFIIDGTGAAILMTVAKATTGYTLTYNGTPNAGDTYKIVVMQMRLR